jgi:hypothetical protein
MDNVSRFPDMVKVSPEGITREEFEKLSQQVTEIHQFVSGLAQALNSPMVKSMLPANLRGMLGS